MCDSFIDDNDDLAVATCHLPRATFYFPLGRQRQHVKTDWGHLSPRRVSCVSCMQNSLNLFVVAKHVTDLRKSGE